jgi:tetratricopeptide (TPR) repeat protein
LAYLNLGLDLQHLHDDSGAETAYRTALKLEPNNAKAARYLADLLRTLGRADEIARLPAANVIPPSQPVEARAIETDAAGVIKTDAVMTGPTARTGALPDLNPAPALETQTVSEPRPDVSD